MTLWEAVAVGALGGTVIWALLTVLFAAAIRKSGGKYDA